MIAFIKSIHDFSTIATVQVASWDLPLATVGDDTGSVVLLGESAAGREGNWLVIDERVYLISQTAANQGQTTLTLQMPVNAFDRSLYYSGAVASIEAFIVAALTGAYKNASDSFFAMPYLSITADSETAFTPPELSDGMYVLSDYIKAVQPPTYADNGTIDVPGVICDISCSDTTLYIRLHSSEPAARKAVFDTSLFQLVTRTHDRDIISKVSVIHTDTGNTAMNYYLKSNGAITPIAPNDRVPGKWVSVPYNADEAVMATARKEFEKNRDTHKIEFRSKEKFDLLDPVTMRMGGDIETYPITCIRKSSADDRYLYTCGDMPTTLTDKVRRIGQQKNAPGQKGDTGPQGPAGTTGADYIIETGTSGKWAYRKWASGIGECWVTLGFTSLNVSNTWGSMYYATWMNSEINKNGRKYPFDFVEEPTVTASPGRGGNDYWLVTDTANNTGTPLTHAPAFCIARASAGNVASPQVAYYVVGKWK